MSFSAVTPNFNHGKVLALAVGAIRTGFPADIRDAYADRLGRRLRFNMVRLWLVFRKQTIDTAGLTG
jgi:hypothetical protein